MKNILLAAFGLLLFTHVQAQNRKYASNFSVFQQYFNPALTGQSGSVVKSFCRNQWAGFSGAPTTVFVSGEMRLEHFRHRSEGEQQVVNTGIQHAVGLSILHDSFGPFVENEVTANYRSQVQLTQKIALQAGGGIAWHGQSLDGSKLTAGESGDPSIVDYIDQTSRSGRIDFNVGLALTGEDFYVGYAMQNLRGETKNTEDFFRNNSKIHYVAQAGYRRSVSDAVGLVFNGLFRYDHQLNETIEGQVKGVFLNTAWFGIGYRKSLAYSMNIGFRMKQFTAAYSYEVPTGEAHRIGGTNELVLIYDLQKIVHPRLTRKMSIW